MYRLNNRFLYTRTPMLQRPINYHMAQARRSYATDRNEGGGGLKWVALLALAAGGYMFFSRRESQPQPLSDPYQRTKENISQISDKVSKVGSDINKEYGDDLSHQVNKVGEHLKSTASIASDAAQTAYKDIKASTKDDVEALKENLKDETAKLTHELKVETDRFRAEHHLKEGDRPADDIVAHSHDGIYEAPRVSVSGKKMDVADAAFNAASKFSTEVQNKAKSASEHLKTETGKFKQPITNPMVDEKRSAGITKTPEDIRLEDKAKNVVHDTSVLVDHDTQKVKDVWKSKDESNDFTYGSNLKTTRSDSPTSSLSSSWEDLKEDAKDAWQDTKEQVSKEADRLKRNATTSYNDLKHDAQDAFRKETLSAKEAWEDTKDQASTEANRLHRKATTSYNNLKNDAQDAFRKETLSAKEAWEDGKDQAASEANRLHRKATTSYNDLKKDAQDAFRNETLTAKEDWVDPSTASRLKREASDTLDDLTNKAKKKANEAQSTWTSLKENVKDDAQHLLNKAEDATGKYKQEASKASADWDKTQRDAQAKAGELKRNVSETLSNSAQTLKKESDKTAKNWFNKAESDVDEGLNWAEKKVDEAKHWAQENVEEFKDNLKNAQEKISGGLKGNENWQNLKPAEVVVEDAKRHNI